MISPFLNVFYSLCFSHLYLPTCSVFAFSICLKKNLNTGNPKIQNEHMA